MAAPDDLKTYQRRIAQLDAAYRRAQGRLADQRHKRADLIAARDQLVTQAQHAVEQTVATMAAEIGPELTAHLTGCDARDVRRLLKRTTPSTPDRDGCQGESSS